MLPSSDNEDVPEWGTESDDWRDSSVERLPLRCKARGSVDSQLLESDPEWWSYLVLNVNTLVPHFGHVPLVAGLPFFRTTCSSFLISTFSLHFTQYACMSLPPCEL